MNVTVDPAAAAKLDTLRDWFLECAGTGELYLADIAAPTIEQITGGAGDGYRLLDLPEGYTRAGTAAHRMTPLDSLNGTLDAPLPTSRYQRALVRSTVADEHGEVYVVTVAPRVRPEVDRETLKVALFTFLDPVPGGGTFGPGSTYALKVMFGGPGWVAHMRASGVEL